MPVTSSLAQLKVMSAIESCRTAALGGHVARCEDCAHTVIAYNSCRNRHCPKCQGAAARTWMEEREAELLPVPYFHVVFTLPAAIGDIAYQNKAVVYDLLFKAASETMLTIAADPKHLGARIAITAVLHTWGSAMTHHPHVHMIVPGGGLSEDGKRWIAARPNFFLPVLVLSRLFRRLMLEKLAAAHKAGKLQFFGAHAHLADAKAFAALSEAAEEDALVRLRQAPVRRPDGGARLSVALHPPRRHLQQPPDRRRRDQRHLQGQGLPHRWTGRYKTMTLDVAEFIRSFLLHVLPKGFHRIRHYGLLASGARVENIDARPASCWPCACQSRYARSLPRRAAASDALATPCPCCGGRMIVIETFQARLPAVARNPTIGIAVDFSNGARVTRSAGPNGGSQLHESCREWLGHHPAQGMSTSNLFGAELAERCAPILDVVRTHDTVLDVRNSR